MTQSGEETVVSEDVIDVQAIEEVANNLPAVRQSEAMVTRGEISVEEIIGQKDKIVQVMKAVMREGVHYGLIPGVNKPSLFKPGAEVINVSFRLAPHYESEKIWHDDGHLTVITRCTLKHIPTSLVIATGEGLCTTKETRYAYRNAKRKCPECGTEAIIKGKAEYGGGWVCWKKENGCGKNFADGDPAIEDQEQGKIANPDIADTYNTVLKMADKRALIAAVLNGTAASDVFTQDVEDGPNASGSSEPVAKPPPVRMENDGLPMPKSWAKVTEYVSAYDEGTHDWFFGFAEQARMLQFGTKDKKEMTKDQKTEELRVAGIAALALRNTVDSTTFPPPTIEDVRKAWAVALDGQELALPEEEDSS